MRSLLPVWLIERPDVVLRVCSAAKRCQKPALAESLQHKVGSLTLVQPFEFSCFVVLVSSGSLPVRALPGPLLPEPHRQAAERRIRREQVRAFRGLAGTRLQLSHPCLCVVARHRKLLESNTKRVRILQEQLAKFTG